MSNMEVDRPKIGDRWMYCPACDFSLKVGEFGPTICACGERLHWYEWEDIDEQIRDMTDAYEKAKAES